MAGGKLSMANSHSSSPKALTSGTKFYNSRNVFPTLMGFTICYQVVYQAIMFQRIQNDEALTTVCDANTNANSPECLELRLFRSWKRLEIEAPLKNESSAEAAFSGVQEHSDDVLSFIASSYVPTPYPTPSPSPWMLETSLAAAVAAGNDLLASDGKPEMDDGVQAILDQQRDRIARWEEFDKMYNDGMEVIQHHVDPFAKKLLDTQAELDANMETLHPGWIQWKQANDRKEEFDRLYNSTLALVHNRSSVSAYAQRIKNIQEQIEAQKRRLPSTKRARALERKARFEELYNESLASVRNRSASKAWVRNLKVTQDGIQKRLDDLNSRRHPANTTEQGPTLMDQINAFHRELCEAPHRRNRSDCVDFMASATNSFAAALRSGLESRHAAKVARQANLKDNLANHTAVLDAQLAKIHDGHKEWQEAFVENVEAYDIDLCKDPTRSSYPFCQKLLAAAAAKGAPAPPLGMVPSTSSLRGAGLSWSGVVAASAKKTKGAFNVTPVVVTRDKVKGLKWAGKVPKVACIVAVPSAHDTKAKMRYFIDNFQLQNYEGERELVLVYRHADADVEKLVKQYADGTLIRAVPAHDHGNFPSTTALRYGAWSTDAQVIARWNFDEWHHPDQLAFQVRALALTSRPVSLLNRWTILSARDDAASDDAPTETILSDSAGWEGSMVGEAKWMQSHWMPMLPEERHMLSFHAADVVQVNIPEMLVYSKHSDVEWKGVLTHFSLAVAELPAACYEEAEPDDADLAAEVGVKAGAWVGELYRSLLTKRQNVTTNLRALCDQAEREPTRRESMVVQVEHIASMKHELTTHFEAVKALYHTHSDTVPSAQAGTIAKVDTSAVVAANATAGMFPMPDTKADANATAQAVVDANAKAGMDPMPDTKAEADATSQAVVDANAQAGMGPLLDTKAEADATAPAVVTAKTDTGARAEASAEADTNAPLDDADTTAVKENKPASGSGCAEDAPCTWASAPKKV
jgi:hypothetical protein